MVAGVEVDRAVVAQPWSQSVGRPKRLPKGGMEPGVRPVNSRTSSRVAKRIFLQPWARHRSAVELPIGRDDEHHEALFAFADQRLGPARQRRAAYAGRLFAGKHRLVPEHVVGDPAGGADFPRDRRQVSAMNLISASDERPVSPPPERAPSCSTSARVL